MCRDAILGEYCNIVDVPEEGDEDWQQNESWWSNTFGGVPPQSAEPGKYFYFYESNMPDPIVLEDGTVPDPDVKIEIPWDSTFDHIYMYKIDE